MRKLVLFGFLGLMCYHLLGFFTYFEWKRHAINEEVETMLKSSIPENKLTKIHFTKHEFEQLIWTNSNEFMYKGHYYDVFKRKQTNSGFYLLCISDQQETNLFSSLRAMTSYNLSQTGENHPVNVWFKFLSEPMEFLESPIHFSLKEIAIETDNLTSFKETFYSCFLSKESPPPDILS